MIADKQYQKFLNSKRLIVRPAGFDVGTSDINPLMFSWQRDITRWALRKGRAGIFLDTGLGKTLVQLCIADAVCKYTGGNFLLFAPLAVSRQTLLEASKFGITTPVKVCTSQESVQPGITITNYEKLHKFDASQFVGVGLDEASILKSVSGKIRDKLIATFQQTPYRFAFTATPSPNDTMEIGSYCEFLGIMNRSEMLSTFFNHDGGETSKWVLRGHAKRPFFEWMASWAVMIRKPGDIGYSNEGYDLPPLNFHMHEVETPIPKDMLFQVEAKTLSEKRDARRDTIKERVELLAGLTSQDEKEPWVIWCNLNDESKAAASAVHGCVEITGSQKDWEKEQALIDFTEQIKRRVVTKPKIAGFGLNWQHCANVAFVGLSDSYEQFYQAIRRCYRFGQKRPVNVHIIISDRDSATLANIQRKQKEADELVTGMVGAMSDLSRAEICSSTRHEDDYNAEKQMELPSWM